MCELLKTNLNVTREMGVNSMLPVQSKFLKTIISARKNLAKIKDDEQGVTMLEYTILIGIITVAVILAVVFAGSWVASQWTLLTSALT
jgi:pilus assembly protein Flp/PilA